MKQTAVEWLIQEYFGSEEKCSPLFRNKIKQAKELEKQQIIDAIDYCRDKYIDSENYYNQEFNK